MPHAEFLLQLPQLQSLKLLASNGGLSDTDRILQAEGACRNCASSH